MTQGKRARLLCIDVRNRSSLYHKRTYCFRPTAVTRELAADDRFWRQAEVS